MTVDASTIYMDRSAANSIRTILYHIAIEDNGGERLQMWRQVAKTANQRAEGQQ